VGVDIMVGKLKLYVCYRGKEAWRGALLIFAENENEAKKIFMRREFGKEPYSIEEIKPRKGVIYDDYTR